MVNIGDKITFIPTAYMHGDNGKVASRERIKKTKVTGKVVQVNRRHGWYRVAYPTKYYGIQHECFKF